MSGLHFLSQPYVLPHDYRAIIRVAGNSIQDLCPAAGTSASLASAAPDPEIAMLIEDEARKVGRKPFFICVGLDRPPEPVEKEAMRHSVSHYFSCEAAFERQEQRHAFRRAMIFAASGLLLLGGSLLAQGHAQDAWSSLYEFVKIGLAVSVWVFFWQSFISLASDWRRHRRKARRCRRIATAPIKFGLYLLNNHSQP